MKKQRILMWLIFLFMGITTMNAQQYQLNGVVLDDAGEPVIGATVIPAQLLILTDLLRSMSTTEMCSLSLMLAT